MCAAWVSHLLNNWIGDDGWLAEIDLQMCGFNYHGDAHGCTGRVTGKGESADGVVSLEVAATSPRDETTTRGTAKVLLASKVHGRSGGPGPGRRPEKAWCAIGLQEIKQGRRGTSPTVRRVRTT